jgi:hypothetical protein
MFVESQIHELSPYSQYRLLLSCVLYCICRDLVFLEMPIHVCKSLIILLGAFFINITISTNQSITYLLEDQDSTVHHDVPLAARAAEDQVLGTI